MNNGLIGLPSGRTPVLQPRRPGELSARSSYWAFGWPGIGANYGYGTVSVGGATVYLSPFVAPRPFAVRSLQYEVTTAAAANTATVGIASLAPSRPIVPTAGTATLEADIRCTVIAQQAGLSIASTGNVLANLGQELALPPGEYATFILPTATFTARMIPLHLADWGMAGENMTGRPQALTSASYGPQFVANWYSNDSTTAMIVAARWRYLD